MNKIKYIVKGLLASLLLVLSVSSCDSYNVDLIDELLVDRAFSPIDLKATVRNQTNVELNWTTREDVDHYVVEFSADDETFATIYKTVNVQATELPVTVALEGETKYSIRVKAVSARGLEDSKWSVVTATTLSEQIFTSIIDGDILAKEATLRWIPNSSVTQITIAPGDITHVITAQEKMDGVATITGLSGETAYTATLWNGTKKRGVLTFTTGIDVGDATLISPTDDLLQKIADAASGDVLVLEPGDYTAQVGTVSLAKSITLRGLRSFDKPKLKLGFLVNPGLANLSLIDLDLTGNAAYTDVIKFEAAMTCGDILISGCEIRDYNRSLITVNSLAVKMNSFTVENSIISKGTTTSGDFIDLRSGFVASLMLKNSTFNDCVNGRDFIREDNGSSNSFTGTGLTSNISIESCTLYLPRMTNSNRILYVRLATNTSTVNKNLFIDTPAIYSNQSTTTDPVCNSNNYYNSPNLFSSTIAKYDKSSNYTTLDPQVLSKATGDFTISNQTLKDNLIGDPRWIK
ncbi:DUF5123 domain-containing protein [Flavobacterium sp. L1I52]|uniref:DUF5123 domain-containing protein n=1 Tax=Flavobacterium pokkalii TaxID=1940408 RepID=A0ABR7UNX8_9FLAO|nr:DUF4957 domain-containing protein [Flavobacterium pokkalii]KQB39106.1 Fibronectin, type III domain-containing protein [Flavobacterium daejeonense]MBD0724146.1 DUF5123 domain-containing protein [Flavobacterium pokkalii]